MSFPREAGELRVVTDSSSALDSVVGASVTIVPVTVTIAGETYREGVDIDAHQVAEFLRDGERVTTSQPPPAAFTQAYEDAAEAGARGVLSIHLSGELSGTVHAAALAAASAPLPVRVVDSRTVGLGLGFAALSAAERGRTGRSLDEVAAWALRIANASRIGFVVDSLEYLRRGGRLGATAATLGTAFGVRPVLVVRSGKVEVVQLARGRRQGLDKIVNAVTQTAITLGAARIGIHHVDDEEKAGEIAARLGQWGPVDIVPLGAAIAAHVGPGTLGVVVAPAH